MPRDQVLLERRFSTERLSLPVRHHRPVILGSAGVGATPVLAMLEALVQAGATRDVWWLHGARSSAEHVFAAEARALLARLPNAHTEIFYSAPLSGDRLGIDYTHLGRLGAAAISELPLPTDADVYLCGPAQFMADLRERAQA